MWGLYVRGIHAPSKEQDKTRFFRIQPQNTAREKHTANFFYNLFICLDNPHASDLKKKKPHIMIKMAVNI